MFRLLNLAFVIARTLAMSILLVSALAAHAQQASAEDARRLLHQCATHREHGERQEALAACGRALAMFSAAGDHQGEATTLNNIGAVYSSLGEHQEALEYYQRALKIRRAVGDRGGEARILTNIGLVYFWLGEKQKALEYYQQSLPILRAVGDRKGEARTLNSIGLVYSSLGQHQKALEFFQQALPIERAVSDRGGEAMALNNIGAVYWWLGERQKALEYYQQALPVERALGDREGEAVILSWLMTWWKEQHNRPLAIFFGKQAVNVYQSLRRDIQGLDKDIQKTYVGTITGAYRSLADLLLAEGRLPEAEQALGMLKEQEFKEFTRGAANTPASTRTSSLTASEQHAESILAQALEWQTLDKTPNRSADQQARYLQLSAALTANNVNLANYWQALQTALPPPQARETKVETSATQKLLRQLPAGTVVVYTLVLEDKLDLIVVRPEAMAQQSVAIKRTELADTVEQFRAAIRDRKQGDALLAPARRLYDWMVAPIAAELEGAHAATIAWSLDGVLRYMPVNALYDGRQFLIERYTNVIFTPADTTGLEQKPEVAAWKALGLGVSKQYEHELNALPAVPGELRTIVRDQQDRDSHGPLPGRILLDDAFTEQALEQQLRQAYPLVHIASHFVMGLGTDESYLLLGGKDQGGRGYRLRLSDLETLQNLSFDGTALLALSACQTAMSSKEADGKEVDSLAAIGRQRGAQAVLASLWDVNDASTGRLMADFYQRWTGTRSLPKAEALRQAQLALLQGTDSRDAANTGRGFHRAPLSGDARAPDAPAYSHPYYWAPFILMGNWQ
jgi:CHAT domain-containing protein/Tfp pilus assembly protein PilF